MLKGFEDAFVDVQASVISLCLELLSNSGRTAEKIYVYLYQNNDIDYIDAFLSRKGNYILQMIDIGEKSVVELAKDWFDDCDKNITK